MIARALITKNCGVLRWSVFYANGRYCLRRAMTLRLRRRGLHVEVGIREALRADSAQGTALVTRLAKVL